MKEPNVSNILSNASKAYIIAESIKPLKDATTYLKTTFTGPVPTGKEVEIRFGKLTFDSKKSSYQFSPGIDGIDFVELFNKLRQITYYNFRTTYSKVENYQEGRILTTYDDYTMTNAKNVVYQKKESLDRYDMPLTPYDIRISIANEKTLDPFKPKSEPKYQKIQTRYYFDFKYFEFHLSEIKNNNGVNYEVEVEVKDVSRFNDILKASLIILDQKISIFGDETYKNKITYFQSNLRRRYPYIGKKDETFFDNKPRSISYANAKAVSSGYVVTNKLDGVHYNLVFSRDFAYLVNGTEVQVVSNADEDYTKFWREVLNEKITVLDGELIIDDDLSVIFHVFDVLIVKDENVSGIRDFMKRIDSARQLIESYNSYINKILKIKIKELAYTGNVAEDIATIFKYMYSMYKEEYDEKNDGLVFIAANGTYNDYIYKWKFPSRITMDGIIKLKEKTKNGYIYSFKFYTENKGYQSLQYNGKDLNLEVYYSNSYANVLKDNMIVEAKADLSLKNPFFDIERIRKDKTNPNFIGVAEKTLQDAKRPMGEADLLKYFKKSSKSIEELMNYRRKAIKEDEIKEEVKEEIKEIKEEVKAVRERPKFILKPIEFVLSSEQQAKKLSMKESSKDLEKIDEEQVLEEIEKKELIVEPIIIRETDEEIEKKNALKALAPNKAKDITVLFSNSVFTRIGTIGEGSCFIHSILFSIYKYGYTKISANDKLKYAALVRKKMSDDLEFGTWAILGKGELAKMLTDVAMSSGLSKEQDKKYQDAILSFKPESDRVFYDYIKYMKPKFPNIVQVAKKEYEKYKNTLNSCAYFNDSMLEYATMFFDVNIFIVRDLSRKIESISLDFYKPERSSIFVLHIDSKYSKYGKDFSNIDHFEVLTIKSDAGIETLFDNDSSIVQDALLSLTQMSLAPRQTELVVVEVPTEEKDHPEIKIIEVEKKEIEEIKEAKEEKMTFEMKELIKKEVSNIDALYFMRNKDIEINYTFI